MNFLFFKDEHAKQFYSASHLNSLRNDSPDYMNIEYFKQQQQLNQPSMLNQSNVVNNQPNQLMQKLELDFEQQEKIYQSVLSKNARLEIANLQKEVAKQKQLKEKEKQNQSLNEESKQDDDSKLSNLSNELEQDILPPPLNLEARSIKRRDSERSARLAQLEKNQALENNNKNQQLDEKYNDEEEENADNTDGTDDNSDEMNLLPDSNPFIRSQFRRSFMNAVYTPTKSHNIATNYAIHAYCGPIDVEDDLNGSNLSVNDKESIEKQTSPKQLTMLERREQLQRLLHSDSSLESDINNDQYNLQLNNNNQNIQKVKSPRNTFKLTKDCLLNSKSVRAMPVIVATPEKSPSKEEEEEEELNESISRQISQNINQVNHVKKQLAFDLIEPVVLAHKPPRGNSKVIKKKQIETDSNRLAENDQLINVKDRIKLLEQQQQQQQQNSDSLPTTTSSNSSLNLQNTKDETVIKNLILEPINLTNRLRSNSLTLYEDDCKREDNIQSRQRTLSGQNLNYPNKSNELNHHQINNLELNYFKENDKEKINDKQLLNENLNQDKMNNNELKSNNNQEAKLNEDDGYLTMESKLSLNNENDEQLSLDPLVEQQRNQNSEDKAKDEEIEKSPTTSATQDIIPLNVNFDEVFGATKTESENEQNPLETNKWLHKIINHNHSSFKDEDDNRKNVDDQFAIYSGLNTIKKAPANYQNRIKLTSALIEQKPNCKQNQLSQFLQVSCQQTISQAPPQIVDQLNNLQLNSMQHSISSNQLCNYKPQQNIVASSLINRSNNLVFVSNPVISPEMMDANPAYEIFDGILYGQSCLPASNEQKDYEYDLKSKETKKIEVSSSQLNEEAISKEDECELNLSLNNDNDLKDENGIKFNKLEKSSKVVLPSSSSGTTNAPYYYGDLLSDEQQLELNNNNKNDENRPSLSSRCAVLNNSRNMSVTSLQKLITINKNDQEQINDENKGEEGEEANGNQLDQALNNEESAKSKLNSQIKELSNSMSRLSESTEMYSMNDPVYENVNRLTSSRSQSSINLNAAAINQTKLDNYNNNKVTTSSYTDLANENKEDDYLNENVLRKASHNYMQNIKIKPIEKLSSNNNSNQEEDEKLLNNSNQTPTKLNNNSIKNALNNHKTTSIHLRSPTVAGYATIDSEQTVLINEDYKIQQSPDIAINTNNANSLTNKLSHKPNLNLISHSSSNLNKMKLNNLQANYYESDSTTTSSSLTSAQSLNQLPLNTSTYYRQQSAPNLSIKNNLSFHNSSTNNYHGNNLNNNNAEKCLANKQLNLNNNNLNKINNLLNVPASINGQEYVVYENAETERDHLLALQKQQQQILLQQQEQIQMLQNQISFNANQPQLPSYSSNSSLLHNNSSSILNDSTIPFEHHLKNLENVPILQNNSKQINNKNYHNYQNIFQDDQQSS